MNPGQEQFYHFILERVQQGKQEDAKALLQNSFAAKQAAGTFDAAHMQEFNTQLIPLLQPEHVDEVQNILTQFGSQHQSK